MRLDVWPKSLFKRQKLIVKIGQLLFEVMNEGGLVFICWRKEGREKLEQAGKLLEELRGIKEEKITCSIW